MKKTKEKEWNFIDRFIAKWRYKFALPYLDKSKIVCDIGCGKEGLFLCSVRKRIKEGYGFDFKLKNTCEIKNIKLMNTDFKDYNKKYNLILLFAVLEHINYPNSFLKIIRSKLKNDGFFILTTPDKHSKWLLEFLAFKLHLINEEEIRDHKRYFTKKTLIAILKKNGFKKIKHKYFQLGLNNCVICKK